MICLGDPFIKPWSKKTDKILHDLMHNGRIPVYDKGFCRSFGARAKNILDEEWIVIAPKKKKSWFLTPPDVVMVPKRGRYYFFKRY